LDEWLSRRRQHYGFGIAVKPRILTQLLIANGVSSLPQLQQAFSTTW
jgi:hypothetical protein